jgi:hypothetical protein
MDKQTKKLEKATKTRKPRERDLRNQRIGEIIRELKQNQSQTQRMTLKPIAYDIESGKTVKPADCAHRRALCIRADGRGGSTSECRRRDHPVTATA